MLGSVVVSRCTSCLNIPAKINDIDIQGIIIGPILYGRYIHLTSFRNYRLERSDASEYIKE